MKLNRTVALAVSVEIVEAALNSNKNLQEIIDILLNAYPEVTFSEKDWNQLTGETKHAIITRVKKTLQSIR